MARLRATNLKPTKETFIFYPNPASNYLTIENPNLQTRLIICNIIGELIFETVIDKNSLQIDLGNFLPGIYIIRVGDSESYKLVKL